MTLTPEQTTPSPVTAIPSSPSQIHPDSIFASRDPMAILFQPPHTRLKAIQQEESPLTA